MIQEPFVVAPHPAVLDPGTHGIAKDFHVRMDRPGRLTGIQRCSAATVHGGLELFYTMVTQERFVTPFLAKFNGVLKNVLEWTWWDAVVAALKEKSDGGWYVYYVGEAVPVGTLSPWWFNGFLDRLSDLLRHEHVETYLGIVYVDDFADPSFIKIYDPNNLGSSCGSSSRSVLPSWVLSRVPPTDLHATAPIPGNRRRWWQELLA